MGPLKEVASPTEALEICAGSLYMSSCAKDDRGRAQPLRYSWLDDCAAAAVAPWRRKEEPTLLSGSLSPVSHISPVRRPVQCVDTDLRVRKHSAASLK